MVIIFSEEDLKRAVELPSKSPRGRVFAFSLDLERLDKVLLVGVNPRPDIIRPLKRDMIF